MSLTVLAAMSTSSLAFSKNPPERMSGWQRFGQKAHRAYLQKDYPRSKAFYELAIKDLRSEDETNEEALFDLQLNLAEVLMKSGNLDVAAKLLKDAAPLLMRSNVDPLLPSRYWSRMADLKFMMSQNAAAATACGKSVNILESNFSGSAEGLLPYRSKVRDRLVVLVIGALKNIDNEPIADIQDMYRVLCRSAGRSSETTFLINTSRDHIRQLALRKIEQHRFLESAGLLKSVGPASGKPEALLRIWTQWLKNAPRERRMLEEGMNAFKSSSFEDSESASHMARLLRAQFYHLLGDHELAGKEIQLYLVQPENDEDPFAEQNLKEYCNFVFVDAINRLSKKQLTQPTEQLLQEGSSLMSRQARRNDKQALLFMISYHAYLAQLYEWQGRLDEAVEQLSLIPSRLLLEKSQQFLAFYVFVNGRVALSQARSGQIQLAEERINRMIKFVSAHIRKKTDIESLMKTLQTWKMQIRTNTIPERPSK